MKARIAVLLLVAALVAPTAGADDKTAPLSPLAPGDRVRLEQKGTDKSLIATIESVTGDELVVRSAKKSEILRFDRSQLQTLEVSRGQRTQWQKGAKIGFVPGFLFFGLVGGSLSCIDNPDCSYEPGWGLVFGAVGGAATGAVGGLIGLAFKADKWVSVQPSKAKVSVMVLPIPGRTQFGVAVSF